MLNMMRADIRRIFQSKGIYIWFIAFSTLHLLQTSGMRNANVNDLVITDVLYISAINGSIMPLIVMSDILVILYFLLPFVFMVISTDFSSGAVKNTLSSGMSRAKYYITKLSLVLFLTVLIHAINIIVPTILMTWWNGFGQAFNGEWLWTVVQMFLLQSLLLIGIMSIATFFAISIKKTAGALGAVIALITVPNMIIFYLQLFDIANVESIVRFEPISILHDIVIRWNYWAGTDTMRVILAGIFYLGISIYMGILLFRRAEIK